MKKNKKKEKITKDYHELTSKQAEQVDKILTKAWDNICDNVLTAKDKDKKGIVCFGVLLDVEQQINRFAAQFGLAALLEE
jgi:hypothetical protein